MDKAISLLVMVEDIRKYGLVDVGKSVLETCCLWIWKIELRKLDFCSPLLSPFVGKKLLETYEIKIAFFLLIASRMFYTIWKNYCKK